MNDKYKKAALNFNESINKMLKEHYKDIIDDVFLTHEELERKKLIKENERNDIVKVLFENSGDRKIT